MTVDEFYAWGEYQEERYEYVDGFPVLMSGASRRHDQIVVNILVSLGNQLRGGPCRPFTADTAVATMPRRRRRPDVGIECGERRDAEYQGGDVKLVVEVLSPSTREFNHYGKLDEYRGVETLAYVLLVEPNAPTVMVWRREPGRDWAGELIQGLEARIDLPRVGAFLRFADIYETLTFEAWPRLVPDPPPIPG